MALSKIDVANMVTGAVPVANGGTALTSGFVNGLTMVDQWRLTTNIEDSQDPISTNLAQATGNGAVNIGSSMSQSSGVFTFPSTGIWRIDYNVRVQNTHSSTVKWWKSLISLTTDGGSSFSLASQADTEAMAAEYDVLHSCLIFDVTRVSTHKIRFVVRAEDGYIYYKGGQDQNRTYVTFMKLGDT